VDLLWSPWRYDYVKADESGFRESLSYCIFCSILKNSVSDEDSFILYRAEFNFVILNIYPYVSGHLMVIPYEHVSNIANCSKESSDEMMDLTKVCQSVLTDIYHPNGLNIGMNLGKAAGAGVAEHIHMHILPRWIGDSNFMSAIGQTRTIPESLESTFRKLKPKFN
jgi:ATP adenylyltransferase